MHLKTWTAVYKIIMLKKKSCMSPGLTLPVSSCLLLAFCSNTRWKDDPFLYFWQWRESRNNFVLSHCISSLYSKG